MRCIYRILFFMGGNKFGITLENMFFYISILNVPDNPTRTKMPDMLSGGKNVDEKTF